MQTMWPRFKNDVETLIVYYLSKAENAEGKSRAYGGTENSENSNRQQRSEGCRQAAEGAHGEILFETSAAKGGFHNEAGSVGKRISIGERNWQSQNVTGLCAV